MAPGTLAANNIAILTIIPGSGEYYRMLSRKPTHFVVG
jgi:hypothetical protein